LFWSAPEKFLEYAGKKAEHRHDCRNERHDCRSVVSFGCAKVAHGKMTTKISRQRSNVDFIFVFGECDIATPHDEHSSRFRPPMTLLLSCIGRRVG
jgi:hypothetical protein